MFVGAPQAKFKVSSGGPTIAGSGAVFLFNYNGTSWSVDTNIFLPSESSQNNYGYSVFLYDIDLFWAIGSPDLDTNYEGSVEYYYKPTGGNAVNGKKKYERSTAGGFSLDAYVQPNPSDNTSLTQFVLAIGIPYDDYTDISDETFSNVGAVKCCNV